MLNAKNHAREAEIVAKAGHRHEPTRGSDKMPVGNVTIATNMAGRGTDIKLEAGVVYAKCKVPAERAADRSRTIRTTSLAMFPPGIDQVLHPLRRVRPGHQLRPLLQAQARPALPGAGPQDLLAERALRPAHRRHRAARGPAHRQPASRPVRPAGRPGSSRFFLSLEDDLLKLFMPDWMLKMME